MIPVLHSKRGVLLHPFHCFLTCDILYNFHWNLPSLSIYIEVPILSGSLGCRAIPKQWRGLIMFSS